MYIPRHFEPPSIEAMHGLMKANPFATLITLGSEGLCANHIPMDLIPEPGPYGSLIGHVARANPVWQVADGKEALVVFHGGDAYITPSWYPSKAETGRAVPTWNYAVVHAHGTVRAMDDARWLEVQVGKLSDRQESSRPHPWAVSDAPAEYTEKLLKGIVGVEISIVRLVGQWKLSQNRAEADRAGVAAGLRGSGAQRMADWVEQGPAARFTGSGA